MKNRFPALVTGLAVLLAAAAAPAQQYPTRPVRYIIAFPAGASMDLSARAIAQKLAEGLGQPVVVDNRPGGNTIVAADVAAHSPPDGYTVFMALDSTMTVVPAVYGKVPYDPLRDFAPVTLFSRGAYTITAQAKAPYRTLGEVVAWARANPGKLNIGASTVQTQMLALELRKAAGVDVTYVPYKGTPPMFQALMAGDVDMVIDAVPIYLPHIRSGKLVALATTGSSRTTQLPDIPNVRESGFPQLEVDTWTALFVPAGTPDPIVRRLNTELHKVFNDPDFRKRMQEAGQNPIFPSTPEQLGAMVKAEFDRWGPLIRAAGIKLE
jgi:tripartite-type tricarboxylate transporter receptor subunit TctC